MAMDKGAQAASGLILSVIIYVVIIYGEGSHE
jgi:hypothetical protein